MRAFIILILSLSFAFTSTKECQEDPDFYMALAGVLGKGNRDKPSVIFLPCDTAIIQAGAVLTISRNTYISFQHPSPNNLIIVKGTLLINGEPDNRVKISSSTDTTFFDKQSMSNPWKGLQIEETGSVIIKETEVFGAETPIQSNSEKVHIINSFFFGGKKILLPGNGEHIVPNNHFIDDLDFEYPGTDEKQMVKKSQSQDDDFFFPEPEKSSFFKSPWFYGTIGVIAVAGGSYLAFNLFTHDSEPEKHVIEVEPGL